MRISPRYDAPAVVDIDTGTPDPSPSVNRQRRRFEDVLRALPRDAWSAPSRCEHWTVQDVVTHVDGVNKFWAASFEAARRGEPTRFLATFDPVSVPAQMVAAARGATPEAMLESFSVSNARLAATIDALDDDAWSAAAEAPPGHIALRDAALHALWDAWIHERDVLLPLGVTQTVEVDEVVGCLAYAAALGPALRLNAGDRRSGRLHVVGRGPDVELTVDVGTVVTVRPALVGSPTATLDGDTVELVEALSCRGPAPKIDDEHRWLVSGLAEVFAEENRDD